MTKVTAFFMAPFGRAEPSGQKVEPQLSSLALDAYRVSLLVYYKQNDGPVGFTGSALSGGGAGSSGT